MNSIAQQITHDYIAAGIPPSMADRMSAGVVSHVIKQKLTNRYHSLQPIILIDGEVVLIKTDIDQPI